jgi:hypothetical protein
MSSSSHNCRYDNGEDYDDEEEDLVEMLLGKSDSFAD